MKILAFLQNQWFHNPAKVERLMQVYPDRRESMIRFALFRGCLTGRRLKAAFGEDLCDQIIWEEASPKITGRASDCPPADPAHIAATIAKHQPAVIMTFGKVAEFGLIGIPRPTVRLILHGPHPAARGPQTVPQLATMARHLSEFLEHNKREPLGAGLCDGCGKQCDALYSVDGAPAAGLAMCLPCLQQPLATGPLIIKPREAVR